ncbi:MAG: hypothetical protein KC912_04770 [Proteobacteria bacterium]|nr:hypothetical protein [Pseudomonadota bacterium]
MTISCPTWGIEWASDDMAATLDDLQGLGVNWIAIHPYAGIRADGTVRFKDIDPENPPEWLARPIREAHARDMKVLIKPHLAYWGSPFSWRGDITFEDEAAWKRFFEGYTRWTRQIAAATSTADAFSVGTELDKTLTRETEWRAVITEVRSVSPASLTYAANWTDYDKVPFWDALDAVGVQAYFPLVQDHGTPTADELDRGWAKVVTELRSIAEKTDKPVVLTEFGYPRSAKAALEPWIAEDQGEHEALQIAALDTAIRALDSEPRIVGGFLWKWFPGNRPPSDFAMQRPAARALIETHWGSR